MRKYKFFVVILFIMPFLYFFCDCYDDNFHRNMILFCAAVVAVLQWKESNKIKKAEFLSGIIEKLKTNTDISDALYIIDYENGWYGVHFHNQHSKSNEYNSSNEYKFSNEYKIDSLLYTLDYICYLKKINCIGKNEMRIADYTIDNVLKSEDMQKYLWNLYHSNNQLNEFKYNIKKIQSYETCAFIKKNKCNMEKFFNLDKNWLVNIFKNECNTSYCDKNIYQFNYFIRYAIERGAIKKDSFDKYNLGKDNKKIYLQYLQSQ